MNDSNFNLTITVDEHEILIDALNSYFNIVNENLPLCIESKLEKDDPCLIRFNALSDLRKKAIETWAERFGE